MKMIKEETALRELMDYPESVYEEDSRKVWDREVSKRIAAFKKAVQEDAIKEVYNFCQHTELPDENDNCRECEEVAAAIRKGK